MTIYLKIEGETFADLHLERQGSVRLVCIHLRSPASMSLLPDTDLLFKLLNSALQAADAKGVLLTGNACQWSPHALNTSTSSCASRQTIYCVTTA